MAIVAPELIKNEVLETLTKKTATITSSNLQFHDMDTSPEEIRYIVTSPENGYVANKQDSNQPIFSFSQKDINDGKIIFVLSEKGECEKLLPIHCEKGISHLFVIFF